MKIEINNLTALIQGRDLNLYQRSLAVEEWHKLLNHVEEMEQALSLGDVVGQSKEFYCTCSRAKGLDHDEEGTPYCISCQKEVQ